MSTRKHVIVLAILVTAIVVALVRQRSRVPNAYLDADDSTLHVDAIRPRVWRIIDVHEHLFSDAEVPALLRSMDKLGVQLACLVASPKYTFTLRDTDGFEDVRANNETLIRVKQRWPSRFAVFVTIDPTEANNLQRLQDYVERGADGLKLYLGHGGKVGTGEDFHVMPIDDSRMDPIWSWAEDVQLPIVLHVNLALFWHEFVRVMDRYPRLRVNLPHLGLHKNTADRLERLAMLLHRYPNLYSDISFGYYTFQRQGFETLAANRDRSREFFHRNREKLLFAADMVLTPEKEQWYVDNTLRSYMQFLEEPHWRFYQTEHRTMLGLGLDSTTLRWIYETSAQNWLQLDSAGNLPVRTNAQGRIVHAGS